MKQTCILVVGMHRSGTSALSGTLSILDVYLGEELVPGMEQNVKGFFENAKLNSFNDNLLKKISSSWDDVFYNDQKLDAMLDTSELEEVLRSEFQYSQTFAIKEPRLAYLFPLYIKALINLGIEIKIIIPFRNPLEVAGSLGKRDKFSQEKSLLLWIYNFLLSEKYSRDYPRVFTNFEELIESPEKVINLIDKKLGLNLGGKFENKKDEVFEFLTPRLKHHNISLDNLSGKVPKVIRELVNLVPQLNSDESYKVIDDLRIEVFDYQALFYNSDIIGSIQELTETKQELQSKDQELIETKQELQSKDQELIDADKEINSLRDEIVLLYEKQNYLICRVISKIKGPAR